MEQKKKALIALKKAKTSLEKTIAMIDSEQKCEDIMIQNMAAIGLIKSANTQLVSGFVERSITNGELESQKNKLLELYNLTQK